MLSKKSQLQNRYSNVSFVPLRRQWHPTPVLLPGKSHGQRSLVGCDFTLTFTFHFPALEKEMATHSSVLAWRIPGTGEPGGLPSMGSHRVRHHWRDLAAVYILKQKTTQCVVYKEWEWKWKWSRSVVSDSMRPHRLKPTRLLCPWDFPGKSTGVGCHFLLQRIFPTQGSNLGLLHCRQMLYHLSHQGRQALYTKTLEMHMGREHIIFKRLVIFALWDWEECKT